MICIDLVRYSVFRKSAEQAYFREKKISLFTSPLFTRDSYDVAHKFRHFIILDVN